MIGTDCIAISRTAKRLAERYDSHDPAKLCEKSGVKLIYKDMGCSETAIKALTVIYKRVACIIVNSELPEIISKFIIAHELGHAVLHADKCSSFADNGLFDDTSVLEKEANIFAAELLLGSSEDIIDELEYSELSVFQLAAEHCVPYELLAYKFEIMEEEGYDVPELPYAPDSRFLRGDLGMY